MRIGSLFSGYGGLDLAVMDVIPDTSVAWHVEFDKAPRAILHHHWPEIPNYGDVTAVDWAAVEPVDIITGGFPCQDLSHAGKRAGLRPGTRSGLWSHMAYAISILRPSLVVIENVLGILSARAASDVEPCAWCVGDTPDGVLRALGAVCGDLADLGYDARWTTVRAADAGSCHGRARVFITANPQREGLQGVVPVGGVVGSGVTAQVSADPLSLLPTPDASADKYRLGGGASSHTVSQPEHDVASLLPTPTSRDHKDHTIRREPHRPDAVDTLSRALTEVTE